MLEELKIKEEKIIPEGYSGEEEDPGRVMGAILHITTFIFPFLFFATMYCSLLNLYHLERLSSILIALPFAWLAGDFITGIVHWLCDTYGTVDTPLFGQTLIRNFRSHHTYPKDICISPFAFTVGYVAVVAFFTLPICIYYMLNYPDSFTSAIVGFTYGIISFLTLLTNQFHKWAHLDKTNVVIRFLQKTKIILGVDHHTIHHTNPFNSNYCITHGLMNPFLEKIKFFRRVENTLAKFGIKSSAY